MVVGVASTAYANKPVTGHCALVLHGWEIEYAVAGIATSSLTNRAGHSMN